MQKGVIYGIVCNILLIGLNTKIFLELHQSGMEIKGATFVGHAVSMRTGFF